MKLPLLLAAGASGALLAAGSACTGKAAPTPTPVFPGSADLERARLEASGGNLDHAADALSEAMRQIEDKGPLRIRNMQLVKPNTVGGFGLYVPLGTDTLKPGDDLVVYLEPSGMSHGSAEGQWQVDLAADEAVLKDGAVMVEKDNYIVQKFSSHAPNREIQFTMTIRLDDAVEGDCQVRVTLHDQIGKKSAVETIPVKFRK